MREIDADASARPVDFNRQMMEQEVAQRVADEPFVTGARPSYAGDRLLVAAVDGSTRGGVLSGAGEETDFYIGNSPVISINTAVALIDRRIQVGEDQFPAFLRLPEKPEDMQREANRYTVMTKLFYPDLSDSQFMHSVWNAMDALEARTALRVLSQWRTTKDNLEVRPADVVMRDGTASPQDRDFNHYKEQSRYGEIVRDMINTNWDIARKCQTDKQTVAGIVKQAYLRIFGPVLNWYASQSAARKDGGIVTAWPLQSMNLLPDQAVISRLLTAGRDQGETWERTCLVMRPFHSTDKNLARRYSRAKTPVQLIFSRRDDELKWGGPEAEFWRDFRGDGDAYMQMLNNVWYATCFVAAIPRLDADRTLPRIEVLVPARTYDETSDPPATASRGVRCRGNLLRA